MSAIRLTSRLALAAAWLFERFVPTQRPTAFSDAECCILFVCLGNICRSPLAEGLARKKLAERGLLGRVAVDSAGTSDWNTGSPPAPYARLIAARHNFSIGDLRARRLRPDDFRAYDLIFVFDSANLQDVRALACRPEELAKVRLLRADEIDIADPFPGALAGYAHAYESIDAATDALVVGLERRLGAAPVE